MIIASKQSSSQEIEVLLPICSNNILKYASKIENCKKFICLDK